MTSHRGFTTGLIASVCAAQSHVCIYCLLPFGTVVMHKGNRITTKPQGDHFVPWGWSGTSREDNLVVACVQCNHLKSNQVFKSVEDARRHVLASRVKSGYRPLFVPQHPITEDAWAWASEYARWMIDA